MCSTLKPKQDVNDKASTNVVSILSAMDLSSRKAFAKRANAALQQRSKQVKQEAMLLSFNSKFLPQQYNKKANKNKTARSWFYWLLSAPWLNFIKK